MRKGRKGRKEGEEVGREGRRKGTKKGGREEGRVGEEGISKASEGGRATPFVYNSIYNIYNIAGQVAI